MKGEVKMFPNLEAELARKKITRNALAKALDVSPNTMTRKLNGETPIYLEECLNIKKVLEVEIPVEKLFSTSI